ncbi:glycine--tRNA ligase subunit beta [Leptolyngbya sp. 'hensonii']|uniref:glycine--tRNA ligase subunit beta n=1 Tax=Leptolyngbya sp. 'hensonii' TaxID=1922337 RepID=UPI000950184C|nr:glycine--tRNA ligase subunit beta [Leptolyngbya sp. 'hensonii']OLP16390.1 glycine--tRNA ligase subunit beta [Leptolyngbya sp. 'hensonii']
MATFLLEVGTEELPASFVDEALTQWRSRIPQVLAENYLTPTAIDFYGTPRRLAVVIQGLPEVQPDREEEVKGPPAQAAFKDGKPTKAAEGFAQKQGVNLSALEIRPTEKGEFVFVQKTVLGRPVAEMLAEQVPAWITGLEGKRLARWGDGDLRFSRPIRWLITLLDETVLPVQMGNGSETLRSDRLSQGHRVLHPEPIAIAHADAYLETLRSAFVEPDPEQRRRLILEQVQAAAEQLQGQAAIAPGLLQEVINLVEWPTAVVGQFDAEYLELPSEVTITVMESHQRYFPVLDPVNAQQLLPNFITISNGDPAKSTIIAAGNERVIRARLADGKFFFKADRALSLEAYVPRLETVTFQQDLGTMRAKVERVQQIADRIADQLQVTADDRVQIQRTTLLCKADLVTQMVGEFPELQGVMGQKYAVAAGEPEAVATGIFEHYLPKGAGDALPQTLTGQVTGLADRLDTLVGIFSLGMIPSGSSDPFALRRAATAIVNIIWAANLPLNLQHLLETTAADAGALRPKIDTASLLQQLKDFFLQRIRTLLQEGGIDYDLVNAVLGENDPEYTERALQDLLDVRDRAHFLQQIRTNGLLAQIYETVNRSSRLAVEGKLDTTQLDPQAIIQLDLFKQPSESAFYQALISLVPQTQAAQQARDYQKLIDALAQITPTVSAFFDGPQSVLVMDPDLEVRQNRLYLLSLLRNHARVLADFGAIVKG